MLGDVVEVDEPANDIIFQALLVDAAATDPVDWLLYQIALPAVESKRGAVAWAIRQRSVSSLTGSPEAVARLRFPQNVACGFTAPRSSAVGSQHCKCLQLPVREAQFRFQQRCPFFDLVEGVPSEASACPAAAAQHFAPVTLHGPIYFYETPEISGDTVVGIVAAQDGVDFTDLVTDRLMSYSPHQLLQRQKAAPQAEISRCASQP